MIPSNTDCTFILAKMALSAVAWHVLLFQCFPEHIESWELGVVDTAQYYFASLTLLNIFVVTAIVYIGLSIDLFELRMNFYNGLSMDLFDLRMNVSFFVLRQHTSADTLFQLSYTSCNLFWERYFSFPIMFTSMRAPLECALLCNRLLLMQIIWHH